MLKLYKQLRKKLKWIEFRSYKSMAPMGGIKIRLESESKYGFYSNISLNKREAIVLKGFIEKVFPEPKK